MGSIGKHGRAQTFSLECAVDCEPANTDRRKGRVPRQALYLVLGKIDRRNPGG
jgi:hypothetical protein